MTGAGASFDTEGPVGLVDNDIVLPFQIETQAARGKLARLGGTVDRILSRPNYPPPVATLLGELAVLAALVSSALKDEGVLTVQVKGDGPVGMLVADATSSGEIRAYAAFDGQTLDGALAEGALPRTGETAPVPRLIGAGYLAFTIDRGPEVERAIRASSSSAAGSLADCARTGISASPIRTRRCSSSPSPPTGPSGSPGARAA